MYHILQYPLQRKTKEIQKANSKWLKIRT